MTAFHTPFELAIEFASILEFVDSMPFDHPIPEATFKNKTRRRQATLSF